ncbi:hypothetical protein [Paenibacillus polymyxa]|uniref:hypothetical protein n=1 Tax=Paenibacillus polymyxa TaxID=1406 RepID=UPI0032177BDD
MSRRTWLWQAADLSDPVLVKQHLGFCSKKNVSVIYLFLSSRISDQTYRDFIREASALNIKIHAAIGEKTWYHPNKYHYIQEKLLRVKDYQSTAALGELFTGIHFDIEPHTLDEWKTNPHQVLKDWLTNVQSYSNFVKKYLGIELSVALPLALKNEDFSSSTSEIIRFHDKVAIMAYRNFVEGPDSVASIVDPFIALADKLGKPKSIIIGQETKPLKEDKLTYAHLGEAALLRNLELINNRYHSYACYEGVAVHSLEYWEPLPYNPTTQA